MALATSGEIWQIFRELERLGRLTELITDREAELNAFSDELDALADEKPRTEETLTDLRITLRSAQIAVDDFDAGIAYGEEQWKILIQCAICGGPIPMEPGGELHHAAQQCLAQQRWVHQQCRSSQQGGHVNHPAAPGR